MNNNNVSRLRLWEIESDYHCSIIGTCLTLDEARKCFKSCQMHKHSNYEIHGTAVSLSSTRNDVSRKIQKLLNKKYNKYIEEIKSIKTDTEIFKVFINSIKTGEIAGYYWAIISSNQFSQKLINNIFGEIHILSHINGNYKQYNNSEVIKKDKKIIDLTDKQKAYKKTIKNLKLNIRDLNSEIMLLKNYNNSNKENKSNETIIYEEIIKKLENDIVQEKELNSIYSKREKCLFLEIDKLKEINKLLKKEIYLLQNNIPLNINTCNDCEDLSCDCNDTNDNNEKQNLYGKCVLYVGGKTSLIKHYRSTVEENNGKFIYHDGGVEDSCARLPNLLSSADFVFCPLDLISHKACLLLKKKCKKSCKKFVMLHSSGVSTFSNELRKIS